MREPLGDTIIWIVLGVFFVIYISGWILLIVISLLQRMIPSLSDRLEDFMQKTFNVISPVQKYSLYIVVILVLFRIIAELLGWASPFFFV